MKMASIHEDGLQCQTRRVMLVRVRSIYPRRTPADPLKQIDAIASVHDTSSLISSHSFG